MKVSNITSNSPNFSSWKRTVYKDLKDWDLERTIKHRNDTWFCRDGFNDGTIYKHITEKFKNVDKVNTYFFGCSNGCEVYTFLNELFAKLETETIDKFTPILAMDYDPIAVLNALHGCYPVEDFEILKLEECHGQKITENFDTIHSPFHSDIITHIIPKQKMTDCVKFQHGDITKDYTKIKQKNNLVFARNLWPYLDLRKIHSIAKNLHDHMGKNSLLIIGEYDPVGLRWNGVQANELFTNAGFKPTDSTLIYEKQ